MACRSRTGDTMLARGEPMVWLVGGGLAICVLMIVVLLAWIVYQGSRTFMPGRIVRMVTTDGQVHLGELTRSEWYTPRVEEDSGNSISPVETDETDGSPGLAHRQLIRIGNRELTGTPFVWVTDASIETMSEPQWALMIERRRWGPFYGELIGFTIDGETMSEPEADSTKDVTADTAAQFQAWALFQTHHPEVLARRAQRHRLERNEMGAIRDREEHSRLSMREAELRHGLGSAEHDDARRAFEHTQAQTTEQFADVRQRIDQLNAENDRYRLLLSTADGRTISLPLDQIVRAYPANRLTNWDAAGIYVDRWREFLLDEPREANTEGGVFPPLVGTVVMTLLMCVAVVPFGVLAALYLREYAKAGPVVSCVRIAVNNLAGVPSIVFGVFGLGFFCYIVGGYIDEGPEHPAAIGPWVTALLTLVAVALLAGALTFFKLRGIRTIDERRWSMRLLGYAAAGLWITAMGVTLWLIIHVPIFNGFFAARAADGSPTFGKGGVLWASLTLALLTLPVVIVATEEALAAVPRSMREGSFACGASQWQTIHRIVLPRALPGIMTGMILAMARGAGEVAPLMLVGAVTLAPELPVDGEFPYLRIDRSFMHLGFHIYDVGFQSPDSESARPMVYTTTLLLVAIIALLNLSAFWLRSRLRRVFQEHQF